tara:strand:- start:33 stop:674 length:642 start_codon:yes stop_codon:yes gene_type:complete
VKILSHRGYWKSVEEKNSRLAFERSFKLGFGTETDLRDYNGEIVISHDMPTENEMTLTQFLDLASDYSTASFPLTLALNIKADGLHKEVSTNLTRFNNINYFLFDMSVPDMRIYIQNGLTTYTRYSDVEQHPVYFEEADGVWLDNFSKDTWIKQEILSELLSKKKVCVVSAELHNNNPEDLWNIMHPLRDNGNLSLCTDKPEEAFIFFGKDYE